MAQHYNEGRDLTRLNQMKAEAAAWQARLAEQCDRALADTGTLSDAQLCRESTQLELLMLSIQDCERKLAEAGKEDE